MSHAPQRTPRAKALPIANGLMACLVLGCERIELAGSLRRKTADVGDVEIVCVAKYEPLTVSMFGEVAATVNLLDRQLARTYATGTWQIAIDENKNGKKYSLDGDKLKKLRHVDSGLTADLFIVTPRTFGALYTIRTGPDVFSHWLVSQALKRGMFESEGLLHNHRREWSEDRKPLPCPQGDQCGLIIDTFEERDFFAAIGVKWLEPELRGEIQL